MTQESSFENLLETLRSAGFWLGELAEHRPAPNYTPRATFRAVLYHNNTATNITAIGWGNTPAAALLDAKLTYERAAYTQSRHRSPLTLKDLGL